MREERSDVFMSNYELGAIRRLKLDYMSLSQINPRLIYASVTGYGTVGPDKDERCFDFAAAWARTGIQHLIGEPGSPPPQQRGGMKDRTVGGHMVAGILAALWHRERKGVRGKSLNFLSTIPVYGPPGCRPPGCSGGPTVKPK